MVVPKDIAKARCLRSSSSDWLVVKGKVSNNADDLQANSVRPDALRQKWPLPTDDAAFVPG